MYCAGVVATGPLLEMYEHPSTVNGGTCGGWDGIDCTTAVVAGRPATCRLNCSHCLEMVKTNIKWRMWMVGWVGRWVEG